MHEYILMARGICKKHMFEGKNEAKGCGRINYLTFYLCPPHQYIAKVKDTYKCHKQECIEA